MVDPKTLRVGDVCQINPAHGLCWGGCFMLVTEPKSWGAQGFVAIPGQRDLPPGEAYLRIKSEHLDYIGPATWLPQREADDE